MPLQRSEPSDACVRGAYRRLACTWLLGAIAFIGGCASVWGLPAFWISFGGVVLATAIPHMVAWDFYWRK